MTDKIGNKPMAIAPQIEKPTPLKRFNIVNQIRNIAQRKKEEYNENKLNALELEKVFVRTELINFLDKITEFKSKMDPSLYNDMLMNIPYSLSPAEKVSNVDQTLKLNRNIDGVASLKLLAKAVYKGSQKVDAYVDNMPTGKALGGAEILKEVNKFDEYMPQAVTELLAEESIQSKLNEILTPKTIDKQIEVGLLPAKSVENLETENYVSTINSNLARINTPLISVEIHKLLKYALTIKNERTRISLLQNIQTYTQKYLESRQSATDMPGPYEWIITRAKGVNQTQNSTNG